MREPMWEFGKRKAGPSIDGNIARLFNTGDSAPPPAFRRLVNTDTETAASAVIYGREGIANCVDASLAAQRGSGSLGLDFYFEEFHGADSLHYWRLLDLKSLAARCASGGIDRVKDLGLSIADCLTDGPQKPIRILTVIERAGGGMPGSLDDPDSVLLRALMNVGEAQVRSGAAGSYGFGKAAVAQASRLRTMIVYTCTPIGNQKDGISRRLMGISYWGGHTFNGARYTGWGVFGSKSNGEISTLDDDDADSFAASLDIPVRSPSIEEDIGTTFMIIDPMFGAEELKGAVEVFWWPLLQRTREVTLDLNIYDIDGSKIPINIDDSHPELGQFVSAFRSAETSRMTGQDVNSTEEIVLNREAGITSLQVTQSESPIETPTVALMRSPLMVVSYIAPRGANRPIVGVFVAHEKTNENLRRVEPAEHDKWLKRRVAGLNASTQDIRISKLVNEEINNAAVSLRSPEPEPVAGLVDFSKHFPAIDGAVARPKPPTTKPKKQRLVRVNLVHSNLDNIVQVERPQRIVEPDGKFRATATVNFWLDSDRAKRVKRDYLDATVRIGARIHEDGGTGAWLGANVNQIVVGNEPTFFAKTHGDDAASVFEGRFLKGQNIYFEVITETYDPDWTVDLIFDCDPWDVVEPQQTISLGGD